MIIKSPVETDHEFLSRPTRITYPNGEGVQSDLHNARNQITTKELSNGVNTSYTYDSEKLLLDRIYTESLQDLNYDFDNVGNILEIEDNVMDSVKTYGYDDLDRLTSADMSVNSVSTYQRDFSYDQYGCIQQVNENDVTISSYEYNLTPFHAPDTYNGNILDYDANGNLVEDEDFTYVYNDANQLSEVRYSGNSSLVEKYWYDANGQRVKKQNSAGEFSYYVNQFYEIENGTATSYFFRDDERIAKESSGDMEWYLSDHLGSTTLLINESGLEVERTEYYPYGKVQSGGLEKYGFTGQENDADTELMYYGARYYSPEYRAFVQPDTMLPDVYNSQALNRYAYCLDNPVKYTDPSGHAIDYAVDVPFLLISLGMLIHEPNLTNLGFFAWDVVAAAFPGIIGSYSVRGPKVVKYYAEYIKAVDDLPKYTRYGYKINTGVTKMGLSYATGLGVKELSDKNLLLKDSSLTDSVNYDFKYSINSYVSETFETDAFNDVNLGEGTLGLFLFDGSVVAESIKRDDGYVIAGVNDHAILWENENGDLLIQDTNQEKEEK